MPSVTQAFVLGAGLGTRLRPLTDDWPKPLIPIFQKPLVTFALDHLIDAGVESFVINTYRQPEAFDGVFHKKSYASRPVELVNEPVLLETGGGIKNIEGRLRNEPFITYSGDIVTDVSLQLLIDEHFRRGNDVTLALRQTSLGSAIAFRDHRVVDISNRFGIPGNYDFANIAIWGPSIFGRIPPGQKISFVPILRDWIEQGGRIGGAVLEKGNWINIGSRSEYLGVHRMISEGWRPAYVRDSEWDNPIHPSAAVDPTAEIRGCSAIGSNCRIGTGAVVEDTIVWPGSQIASRSHLNGCIVRAHRNVRGTHRNVDI